MSSFEIYWITRLDYLNILLIIIDIILFSLLFIYAFFVKDKYEEFIQSHKNFEYVAEKYKDDPNLKEQEEELKKQEILFFKHKKYWLKLFFIFLTNTIIIPLLPSTKETAAIILLPKIYNSITTNKEISQLPNNLSKMANEWIKNQLNLGDLNNEKS
jgi:hypothetical protein